jgi:hypothetical protein
MNIPICPNHKQSTEICATSKLRLHGETEDSFVFYCACCELIWAVSKPKAKERANYENQMRKVQQMSEIDRARASRRVYSIPKA